MIWSEKHRLWMDRDTRTPGRRSQDEAMFRRAEVERERLQQALRQAEAAQARQTDALERAAESQALALLRELVDARRKAGLSQTEVARRMDVPPSAVARLESGAHSPTLTTLTRFAAAIGVTIQIRRIA